MVTVAEVKVMVGYSLIVWIVLKSKKEFLSRENSRLFSAGWLSITYLKRNGKFKTMIFRRYFDWHNRVYLSNNGKIKPLTYWAGKLDRFSKSVLLEYAAFSPDGIDENGISIAINERDYKLNPLYRRSSAIIS